MERVREADLRVLLDVVDDHHDSPTHQPLPDAVLERVAELIGCDEASFTDFDAVSREFYAYQDHAPNATAADVDEEAFLRHYWDCVPCSYPDRSGDQRSVLRISDHLTSRQWHATGMYQDYFSPLGFEHEIMLCLPAPAGRTRRLILFRGPGRDFDDRDRLLLTLLRPHLNELYQRRERARDAVPDLTPRQWELLRLVAAGQSTTDIADRLFISVSTVRKHLENVFIRLSVTSRTAAVARAFPVGAHPLAKAGPLQAGPPHRREQPVARAPMQTFRTSRG